MCVTGDLRPGLIKCKTNIIRDTVCDTPLLSVISVISSRLLPHCSPGHGIVGGESERGCCDWNAVEMRSESRSSRIHLEPVECWTYRKC